MINRKRLQLTFMSLHGGMNLRPSFPTRRHGGTARMPVKTVLDETWGTVKEG